MTRRGQSWPFVGRSEELALLGTRVGDNRGSMVIAGPAGVGKSRLLTGWLSRLEVQGRPAVVVRATRSTATIPFGAFAPWAPEQVGSSPGRLGVLQATAANLVAGNTGSVVTVDDAQFLDEGSAALVLHLVQHTSLPVVLTVREGVPCPDAIVAITKEGLALRHDLAPLSEAQVTELLERALGDTVAPATQQRLWHLTQGNPLYLREVVETGRDRGTLTRSAGAWQWQGALPARTRLVDLVRARIGESGSAERRVLEVIALAEPLPVEILARVVPEELVIEVEHRGLVVVDQPPAGATGGPVHLAHPLYAEVLRTELPPFTGRSHFRALASAALAAGFHHRDPLRVATWLLGSGDTPTEPDLLLRASFLAQNIDDYHLSVRLAEAAEQADGGWRATLRRAEALGPLGRWGDAAALLSTLSSPDSDPEARAAAARVRAQQAFFHQGEDLSVARAIIAEAAEVVPPPARSRLLTYGARLAIHALELEEATRLASAAVADAESLTDRLRGLTSVGFAAVFLGRTKAATGIAELALPLTRRIMGTSPTSATYAAYTYSFALVLEGRIDEAAAFFEEILDQGSVPVCGPERVLPAFWLARAALTQGRVTTATRLCQEALGLLGGENYFGRGTWVTATLATAAAQAGETDAAADALAWADARTRSRARSDDVFLDLARAWLHAATGEFSAAREVAVGTARRAGGFGAWALEMLAWLDAVRLGAAVIAAPRLEELARVVEGPYAEAAAGFARAAASQDAFGLDEAAARFADMGARLAAAEAAAEAARTHLARGQRRQHAASLASAQRHAARCEGAATPLLAQLQHEPVVIYLTDREREVVHLAARGRSSREIAEALVISVRTVDSHLNHAYTKLGIRSRGDLAEVLGHRSQPVHYGLRE